MVFSRILVAIDYSDISQRALEQAISLAQTTHARLNLLHVLPPAEIGTPNLTPLLREDFGYPDAELYAEAMQRYNQHCQELQEIHLSNLRSMARTVEAAGLDVEFTQSLRDANTTICKIAQHWQADLIVMGRRGRKGLSELFLGSTSNYVLHHAPCAVLIVQDQGHPECGATSIEQAMQV